MRHGFTRTKTGHWGNHSTVGLIRSKIVWTGIWSHVLPMDPLEAADSHIHRAAQFQILLTKDALDGPVRMVSVTLRGSHTDHRS